MFHSNTNGEGFDTDGSTLAAGLLTSAAILSDDPGYQWRRGITAYITACIAASRFISFKETTYYYEINNSFSSRSSRDEETSSSSCDRVSESPVNLSTLSQVSIDIPSDNEAEEKNEDEQLLLRNKAAQIVEERDQISLVINMSTDNEAEEKNEEQLLLRNKAAQIVEERDQISLVINRSSDNEVEENNGEQPRLRNEVAQIVKERDLISLKDFGGVEKVASIFDSDLKSGIRSSIQEPETELAELLSSAIQDPIEKTLLEDQIEKINTYVENLSLLVSIFIASVAFIRLLCRRHVGVVDNELPELKGKVSVDMLMKIFEKIVLKPHGKASILASALTVVVIAIQHGMPFVITISLSFWNSKMVKNQAGPQNFSACATMGIVTVMCIDVTGGLVCKDLEVNKFWIGGKDLKDDTDSEIDPPEPQIKTAVKAFKKAGVRIKLVSEEELPAFKGQVIPGMNQDVRKAMIFSSFTISQVFNLFYAMNLVKKEVFLSVLRNFWFLLALVTVMIMQVLVAEYLKSLADCVRLNWIQWCVCFLLAALPCGIHIAVEFISYFFLNWSLESNGLQTLFSRRRPQPYLLSIGIPFSVFIFFTVSYNYNPFIGKTLR
ncbi:hypothetical protein QYF36_003361 [Acer negundo]|nr:hypothetical protein QYF36_003361 [Acer negundo]